LRFPLPRSFWSQPAGPTIKKGGPEQQRSPLARLLQPKTYGDIVRYSRIATALGSWLQMR
jgi:hypothetical protein